jgi:hypothetical protein
VIVLGFGSDWGLGNGLGNGLRLDHGRVSGAAFRSGFKSRALQVNALPILLVCLLSYRVS